ncbi:AraC family transcriptional regulator ligand-binding domain-containing protein [Nocardia sp. NPDC127526]|uniref:AraC family transcriptional regulator n=1 Tax=Nocardia sp. NPDC127526 TaxID=3345393 RepID=UPI00362ED197
MHDNQIPTALAEACLALASRKGWPLPDIPDPARSSRHDVCDTHRTTLLFRHLWQVTGDEMFGLGSHPVPRGAFRVLCLAVSSAPDLGSAMLRFAEAATVFPGLPRFSVETGPAETRWVADVRLVDDVEHLIADAAVVFAHRLFGWMTGSPLRPRRVEFCYPQPEGSGAYERNFQAPLMFGCDTAALVMDSSQLGTPIVQTEQTLAALLGAAPTGFLGASDHAVPLGDRVRHMLSAGGADPWQTVDELARRLSMSAPTLRRKLRAEHTTVSGLREEVLRETAIAGLAHGRETIAELAERLGFSEPSAFTRAFRRWTGSTPHDYRTAIRQGEMITTVA